MGEGLKYTTKGSHEGTGGYVAHFICAIAYGKGTVLAEEYFGNLSGEKFADFVPEYFHMYLPEAVMRKENYFFKMVIHHKIAKDVIYIVGGKIFSIPPRSPELNPI